MGSGPALPTTMSPCPQYLASNTFTAASSTSCSVTPWRSATARKLVVSGSSSVKRCVPPVNG